jgi:hypothetical protein
MSTCAGGALHKKTQNSQSVKLNVGKNTNTLRDFSKVSMAIIG